MMNKRILFGVLILALGSTCKVSLKAKPESTTKIKTTTSSSDGWSMKKLMDNIKSAGKSTPRTPISNEQQARDFFTPPARDTEKPSARTSEVTREKIERQSTEMTKPREKTMRNAIEQTATTVQTREKVERESREAVQVSQPKDKADHIRTATEMTATTVAPQKDKATREKSESSSTERTRTERAADEQKAKFSDSSQTLAIRPPGDIVAVKPSTGAYGRLGVSPDASDAEIKKAYKKLALTMHPDRGGNPDEFDKMKKAYDKLIDPEQRKAVDAKLLEGKKSQGLITGPEEKKLLEGAPTSTAMVPYTGSGPVVPVAKPLDSVTGAIVPYTGKPSASAIAATDEGKPGMSGKKKAALGAGLAGAGAVGIGAAGVGAALGAGLIGAGLIGAGAGAVGVGMSGDKDKPAPEIAPERVEDIKGLDAGSGLDQSFEASPIDS